MQNARDYLQLCCLTAAGLILSAPNAEQTDLINKLTEQNLDASSLAASFENLFCLPGSAKYVPIYEHVLTSAKEINGRFEFDSRISAEASQAIEAEFDKRGFGWHKFVKDMPTVGGTMVADHEGLILVFIAALAQTAYPTEETRRFVAGRLPAIECLEIVLRGIPDPYACALATTINEARTAIVNYFQLS